MAEEAVHRMPYEGYETSVEAAASNIAGLLDSEEEHAEPPVVEETEEAEEETAEEVDLEADAEESEDAEDAEEEGEPEPEVQTFTVKVDGAETEVTLDELLKGYSREADYTRKTQALAEDRKKAEAEAAQYREQRDQWAKRIEAVDAYLASTEPKKPDEALRRENPGEYAAQMEDWRRWREDKDAAEAEKGRLSEEQQAEALEALKRHLAEEQEKLRAALPELEDPEKGAEVRKGLQTYAHGLGFTDAELGAVTDHRLLVILDKARRWDALQADGRKVIEEKKKTTPVLKPGTPKPANKGKKARIREANDRLRRTGRPEDAAAAILASGILDD